MARPHSQSVISTPSSAAVSVVCTASSPRFPLFLRITSPSSFLTSITVEPSSTSPPPTSTAPSMYQLICRQLEEDGYTDLAQELATRASITIDPSIPPHQLASLLSLPPFLPKAPPRPLNRRPLRLVPLLPPPPPRLVVPSRSTLLPLSSPIRRLFAPPPSTPTPPTPPPPTSSPPAQTIPPSASTQSTPS